MAASGSRVLVAASVAGAAIETESGACGPCCVAAWLHCAWKSAYMLLEQVWSLAAADDHGCQHADAQLSTLLVKSALSA